MKNSDFVSPPFVAGWASRDKVISYGWHRLARDGGTLRMIPSEPPEWWLNGVAETGAETPGGQVVGINPPPLSEGGSDDQPWMENDDW